jgi:hypothetical protein
MTSKPAAADGPDVDQAAPDRAARPKAKPPSIRTALNASLRNHAPIGAHDKATVNLAKKLATKMDELEDVDAIGALAPKLLAVLTALGLTPASRAAAAPKGGPAPASTRLDQLRQEADERRRA